MQPRESIKANITITRETIIVKRSDEIDKFAVFLVTSL
jgi:hypothetical protein